MPLLRRRGVAASDAEMRRHSFFPTLEPNVHLDPISDAHVPAGRVSEQTPRQPPGDLSFLHPVANVPDMNRPSADHSTQFQRPLSPPIQEETSKHRRFSMLRFRHASDSQLSTRSRLQARNASIAEDAPPVPHRKYLLV